MATSEITGLRAGTTLQGLLPWPSGRWVGLLAEMGRLRPTEGMNFSDTTCDVISAVLPAPLSEHTAYVFRHYTDCK